MGKGPGHLQKGKRESLSVPYEGSKSNNAASKPNPGIDIYTGPVWGLGTRTNNQGN